MRPIDLYMERTIRDTRSDQQSSRSLWRESQSLALASLSTSALDHRNSKINPQQQQNVQETGMQQRDKMALASIAFCSPLMLLGMGATFAMFDDHKIKHDRNLDLRSRLQLRKSADPEGRERERSILPKTDALNQLSIDGTAFGAKPLRKIGIQRKDSLAFPGARFPRIEPIQSRNWVKTSKIVKEKEALAAALDKNRGEISLGIVAKIVSEIEKLDKALKKMGC